MRAIFLGTPGAAVPSLRALVDVAEVRLVVTRPDRPRGRSGRPVASEVAGAAEDLGLEVARPDTADALRQAVLSRGPVDVGVVVAYGMILRPDVLAAARFLNVHFSLLPRWRGAAPVQRAVLAGDLRTGVSLMAMDQGLDTGPVLVSLSTAIGAQETAEALTERLAVLGGDVVRRWIPRLDRLQAAPQTDALATHAPKLRTEERWLEPASESVTGTLSAVRGLTPWPGAWIRHDGEALRIRAATPGASDLPPGTLRLVGGNLEMGVRDGSVRLTVVQPEGRRTMDGADWARGRGHRLGSVR